jgi:hypothetical protein
MSDNPDKLKNQAVVYWEKPSYTAVNTNELGHLPDDVQKMIAQSILDNLNIEITLR